MKKKIEELGQSNPEAIETESVQKEQISPGEQ